MARERAWATTFPSATGGPNPTAVALLPPAEAVEGVTVMRVLGAISMYRDVSGSSLNRPLATAGVLVATTADGSELTTPELQTSDWLWLGMTGLVSFQGVANPQWVTPDGGQLGNVESRGARTLDAGENVWLVLRFSGNVTPDIQHWAALIRVLYLLPA